MTNAGRSPADAYREFDGPPRSKSLPLEEFATLTRLMQKARPVNIGKTLYAIPQIFRHGQRSNLHVRSDWREARPHRHGCAGVIVPVHDKGFGRSWRDVEATRSEGFDSMVDDAREAELGLMRTMNSFLFAGNAGLSVDGQKWLA